MPSNTKENGFETLIVDTLVPSHKALQTEVEQLIKEKNELYNQYQTAKEEAQRLGTIRHNLEQTLGRKIEHKKEQER